MSLDRLARIDVDLLLAFNALLDESNVTRAARKLSIRQPALSARLTRLRAIFDDRLFIPAPSGRGVLPTPRALALQPLLSAVLAGLNEMVEAKDLFAPATSDRIFTIAMFENPATMLAPELALRMRAAAPHVRLSLVTPDEAGMAQHLETGEVDLFIGIRSKAHDSWLSRALFRTDFVTAQRKRHPRGGGALDLDQFCRFDHLLVSTDGGGFSGAVDDALSKLGRRRHVAMSVQNYGLTPAILAENDLLCTLPRRFLQRFTGSLDLFDPPLSLGTIELEAYWHPRFHDDAGHLWLRDQVFAIATAVRGEVLPRRTQPAREAG